MTIYNFYPNDGGATITNVPRDLLNVHSHAAPDNWGCFEIDAGLYVPTISDAELKERVNAHRMVAKNFADCLAVLGLDIFGDPIA